MTERRNVNVIVLNVEEGDDGWPPERLAEFLAWLQDKIGQIPEEYRAGARIEIDSVGGYEGDHSAELTISYERPENDGERAARLGLERERVESQLAREFATYQALRAKFGGS